tara:strand:- start:1510 stop:2472 length:963 start_codon:yes stop_codon:yes gene_type:complete
MSSDHQSLAIDVQKLKKVYLKVKNSDKKLALNGIDITIKTGEIFGLLGPNGAGKSTLINILAGLVIKTSGQVKICGFDIEKKPRQARSLIGVVPQELTLDPFFSPRKSLELQGGLYGVKKKDRKTEELLKDLHLTDVADGYSRRMSGGMKRRLMVGKAMVHSPPVLVLDEPTAGVDVELRQNLWSMIRKMNSMGTTILLTTHYLEEAEELCDRIAIIDEGNVIACDTTQQLVGLIDKKELIVTLEDDLENIPSNLMVFNPKHISKRLLHLSYNRSKEEIGAILEQLKSANLRIKDLSTKESDLEDVFISLTQKNTLNAKS